MSQDVRELQRARIAASLLDRIEGLEARIRVLEGSAATGLFDGMTFMLQLPTETLRVIDAGTGVATYEGWIEVELNGTVGYLWVRAGK